MHNHLIMHGSFAYVDMSAGYYCVDAKAETAMVGDWKKGPGLELFDALKAKLGAVPILAEDLGVITTDVVQLRWGEKRDGDVGFVTQMWERGRGPGWKRGIGIKVLSLRCGK